MLRADDVVSYVKRSSTAANSGVMVLWCKFEGEQADFVRELTEAAKTCPDWGIVPIRVRDELNRPNSLDSDFVALLAGHQKDILDTVQGHNMLGVSIVLLSREHCRVVNVGSPVTLPLWFPFHSGQLHRVTIVDLQDAVCSPLTTELQLPLSAALYDLEMTCLRKLRNRPHEAVKNLLKELDQNFTLQYYDDTLTSLKDRRRYRPDKHLTFFGLIWSRFPHRKKELPEALGAALSDEDLSRSWNFSLAVVVMGMVPSNIKVGTARFGYSLCLAIASSCRLFNGIAHGDHVPVEYPTDLVRLFVKDVERSIIELDSLVRSDIH